MTLQGQRFSWTDHVALALATGLYTGRIPPRVASGPTLVGIPLAWGLYGIFGWSGYIPALLALWLVGIWICGRAATLLHSLDPKEVVYDEITTLPLVYFCQPLHDPLTLAMGYVLHRLFDISKPLGIRRLERLPGGWGIMLDDVAAAAAAWAVLFTLRATWTLG